MPEASKQLVHVELARDQIKAVDKFRDKQHCATRSEAFRILLNYALRCYPANHSKEKGKP